VYVSVAFNDDEPAVSLQEPTDCRRFHVGVVGNDDRARLDLALAGAGLGHLDDDGDDAWVTVEGVRRLAVGLVGPAWDGEFAAMVDYAAGKGWLSPDGAKLRAHVEWPS
jgi:hypothetical protein